MDSVLISAARNVGSQIKYTHLAEGYAHRTIKNAFNLLSQARVLNRVSSAKPGGLPLAASASTKIFKSLVVDIGLMRHLCGLSVDIEYAKPNLLNVYQGALAEQFVGQEMMLAQNSELYYWSRSSKSSTAEVDFLIVKKGKIIPVEVKSGAAGRLKSMHLLLKSYPEVQEGYVFSAASLSSLPEVKLVFLPLYFAFSAVAGDEREGPQAGTIMNYISPKYENCKFRVIYDLKQEGSFMGGIVH